MDDAEEDKAETFLLEQAKRAIAVRSKDREFHGLEREFMYHQSQMVFDYDKSKDLKHPRDLGDSREEILRRFLTESGLIPKRYGISTSSARVISPTGHSSNEIDILLYDPIDSVGLMNRDGVYQAYPIESVYGVIQVKSRLNKKEIQDGLKNIASYKSLNKQIKRSGITMRVGGREGRGFGLLFAYDSDLKWSDIVDEIKRLTLAQSNRNWCNGIFILNKGMFLCGSGNTGYTKNSRLESVTQLQMFGFPDHQSRCLLNFHNVLLELLKVTDIHPTQIEDYYRLPLIADAHSYEFSFGSFAEIGVCDKHGDYQRKISPEMLSRVTEWCRKTEPIDFWRAMDIAHGKAGDDEADQKQAGTVHIYNPENLPLSEILVTKDFPQALQFDQIVSSNMHILIPYYYDKKESVISSCPQCKK